MGFRINFRRVVKRAFIKKASAPIGSSKPEEVRQSTNENEQTNEQTNKQTEPIEQTGPSRSDLGGYQVNLNDGGERTVSSRSQLGSQGGAGGSGEAIGTDGSNLPSQVGGRRMQRRAKLGG